MRRAEIGRLCRSRTTSSHRQWRKTERDKWRAAGSVPQQKNSMAVYGIERRGHDNEPSTFFSRECRHGCFKIIGRGMKRHARHLDAKARRHGLDCAPHPRKSSEGRIRNTCHPLETGRNFFQQLQPFPPDFRFECAEAGNVGTWPGETLHCPSAHSWARTPRAGVDAPAADLLSFCSNRSHTQIPC